MEYKAYILVPKDRIGALIGKKGKVKKKIEDLTGVKIMINSKTGEVDIDYDEEHGPEAMKAKSIVNAIGRGFSPEKAEKLASDDYYMEIINIQDLVGKSRNALVRQRSRVIGTEGRARKMLEDLTKTDISVYGKTVSIIGPLENVEIAKDAIEMLINGAKHGDVYRYIQKRMEGLFLR